MRTAYRVETVRAAERALMARLPEGTLMTRAAAGLAAACAGLLRPRTRGARVVVLAGSGDNGGDALYAGARLARRGVAVTAVLLSPERAHPGGLAALRAAGGRVAPPEGARELIARAALVVDGITGIGGRGGLRPAAQELAAAAAERAVPVVAVDLPSGVDADTGEVHGAAVRAALTVTFGALKPGLLIDPAREYAGKVRLVDIGLGPELPPEPDVAAFDDADVAALLPRPATETDKYRRGVVGVVAGSERYPGAAVLAVGGALRGGAGAVRYVGPAADAVISRYPETLVSAGPPHRAGRVQAWVVGPGLGTGPGPERTVAEVLDSDVPVLVDADGLARLDIEQVRARSAPTVLTPHAGEAARLLGRDRASVEAGRLAAVRELAERYGATALLKGSTTLVADATGPVVANTTGTPWLATAGSGDVLSGLIGALVAAGLRPREAAATGAHLHGRAGQEAPPPPMASTIAEALPRVWSGLL
ncbi:NAD(P)H-hydrate dehydratase [Streptomyces radicis]|uniref:Bifunctional NAD(P)H-hydrate repair enzyme n=1 Tax=Streptomyces radicis TaxID=1750517 RepID=A0A3A9W6R4_9ACTN|nr:NAD(P)H-hydrate dehydratase [Streptomyces radicis]RKN08093.1 NAD(P)H-hydrate dehydratase [Streptomyces radicis]RKN20448.1 NAD(P)H-hydrate dehydratase [Streptomyces radicis]